MDEFQYNEIRQEIVSLKNDIMQISRNVEGLGIAIGNQQQFINAMIQSINMQIGAINSVNQGLNSLQNKLSDLEINNSILDDSIKDILEFQNNLSNELQEMKQGIDAIKFYTFNFLANQN